MDILLIGNIGTSELILILLVLSIPLYCFIDIIRSSKDINTKILWILYVFLLNPLLGPIIYLVYGKSQKML